MHQCLDHIDHFCVDIKEGKLTRKEAAIIEFDSFSACYVMLIVMTGEERCRARLTSSMQASQIEVRHSMESNTEDPPQL